MEISFDTNFNAGRNGMRMMVEIDNRSKNYIWNTYASPFQNFINT